MHYTGPVDVPILIGNFMLEIQPIDQRGRTATGSTIPYSFNNLADISNLQQYCSIQNYQSGRTEVYNSYIVKET